MLSVKVVSLVLLVLCTVAVITNVTMAFNVQLPSKVATPRTVDSSDDPGSEPAGDPVDGAPCPKRPSPP